MPPHFAGLPCYLVLQTHYYGRVRHRCMVQEYHYQFLCSPTCSNVSKHTKCKWTTENWVFNCTRSRYQCTSKEQNSALHWQIVWICEQAREDIYLKRATLSHAMMRWGNHALRRSAVPIGMDRCPPICVLSSAAGTHIKAWTVPNLFIIQQDTEPRVYPIYSIKWQINALKKSGISISTLLLYILNFHKYFIRNIKLIYPIFINNRSTKLRA